MPVRLSPLGERLIVRVKDQGEKRVGRFVKPDSQNPDADRPAQCCEIVEGKIEVPVNEATHILGRGTTIYIARHKAYALEVNGSEDLLVVDVADVLAAEIIEVEYASARGVSV